MHARLAVALMAVTAGTLIACADSPTAPVALKPSFTELAGGCPDQFSLTKGTATPAEYKLVGRSPADDNGDSYICAVVTKEPTYESDGKTLRSQGVKVVIDNNLPPSAVGVCPLTFTSEFAYGSEDDFNGNGLICHYYSNTEELIVDDVDH
jgi:hypothetical protein